MICASSNLVFDLLEVRLMPLTGRDSSGAELEMTAEKGHQHLLISTI